MRVRFVPVTSVQSRGHHGLQVNAFDNVDFPAVGPRGANHPKCRPGATPSRHVVQVYDEQTRVVGFFRRDADRVAAVLRDIGVVRTHVDLRRCVVDQALGQRVSLRQEIDKAMCRIARGEKVKVGKKICALKIVLSRILQRARHGQWQGNRNSSSQHLCAVFPTSRVHGRRGDVYRLKRPPKTPEKVA